MAVIGAEANAPGVVGANASGFISINALMTEANYLLCKKGYIPSSDPDRAYATLLQQTLAKGNSNTGYVQANPCPRSF